MISARLQSAASLLAAAAVTLLAAGCASSVTASDTTSAAATPPATAAATPPTASAAQQGFPADFIGVSPGAGTSDTVAVYSSANGHLIRTLTQPMPGGGPSAPRLSPDGTTVIFARGQGSCARTIDTVPVRGGQEHVLIPMTGSGNNAVIPGDPSYSADGRYLIYDTVSCAPGGKNLVHVRNLATGREQTTASSLGGAGAVFLDDDREVVFSQGATGTGGTGLEVLRLPSMTLASYPAPSGCRYQALAGDGTALDALLQCGSARQLSVVAIAPGTFTVTTTLARLGVCLGGETLSLASGDPSAMLAETYAGCLRPGANGQDSTSPPSGQDSIVTIRGGQVWRVMSGLQVPQSVSW